jgi:hypothetical protein
MEIDAWLELACADADRRALPELKPLLQTLAQSTRALRQATDLVDSSAGLHGETASEDDSPAQ